jgi:predicted dehydrogenase
MSDKVRIGMIGVGGMATGHARNLKNNIPEAEIVAICDTSEASLANCKERAGLGDVPTFTDYAAMLESVEMDAVEIGSPHTLHYQQILDSLDKGLHVLTEKPMVCTQEHAHTLIKKRDESGKVLMVSYQRHFQPEFQHVRNRIKNGDLGELTYVSALQGQDWLRGCANSWRHTQALSGGGQLNDSGSHLVDIVLWTTGLVPKEVSAFIENFTVEVDINSSTSVRFTNGAIGNFSVIGDCPGWWEDITYVGKEGALFMRNGRLVERLRSNGGKDYEPNKEEMPKDTNPDRNFVDSILGKDTPRVPAECGLLVIELTEGAWESAKNGGEPYRWAGR